MLHFTATYPSLALCSRHCDHSIDNEFYLVKPYLEVIEEGEDCVNGMVAFRIHVYTWKQATGFFYRVRKLVAENTEYRHCKHRLLTTGVSARQRVANTTNFFRIFDVMTGELTDNAGCIPEGAFVVPSRMARAIVGRNQSTIMKIREQLNLPTLRVVVIPANIHQINCITCAGEISDETRKKIITKISQITQSFFGREDKW